ncbi:MAG TPA: CHAT domain-containing protein [Candidatus Krumholzibacteria bacterium]|nr:CHAT domain-containing protein [Candidatus Krumholzibacteria bacterium]HPD73357.1 CHAT domain-containing protein [Candidatus Krumholzibacteria bacterium]HRY42122.1 CHAT domain-containing protein [Candidatus Krumholzibacteria bacterium]
MTAPDPGDGSLGVSDAAPLFICLTCDDGGVRTAALSALVRLPLDLDARCEVAILALDVLRIHGPAPDFLAPLARVPVRQVRERIHDLLATAPDHLRPAIAHALADVGDDAGAAVLLEELAGGDDSARHRAAESAARCGFGSAATARKAWNAVEKDPLGHVQLLVALGIARTGDLGPLRKVLGRIEPAGRGLEVHYADGDPANTPLVSLPPLAGDVLAVVEKKLQRDSIPYLERMLDSQRWAAERMDLQAAPEPDRPGDGRGTEVTPERRARAREAADRLLNCPDLRGPQPADSPDLAALVAEFLECAGDLSPQDAARFVNELLPAIEPRDWGLGNLIVRAFGTARDLRPDARVMMAIHARGSSWSLGQQAAWFASRAPLRDVVAEVADALIRGEPGERIAAASFVETVAGYRTHHAGPVFGGAPAAAHVPMAEMIDLPYSSAMGPAEREPAAAPAAPGGEPADKVYARLDCDAYVVAGREFELIVGISNLPSAGVVGSDLEGLRGRCDYLLKVRVIADGFSLRAGESWRVTLAVTGEQRYPACSLHLTADTPEKRLEPRAIQATYSVDGQVTGTASRAVNVAADESAIPAERESVTPRGRDISLLAGPNPPDLTVILCRGNEPGRLLLAMESPHATVDLPDEDLPVEIGEEPAAYARRLIDTMNEREGAKSLYRDLRGFGYRLAKALPDAFWAALQAVRDTVGPNPTVMLLSDDPYVPWELALLEAPVDPSAAPFLAAQVSLGRWLLQNAQLPAPHELAVTSMAAVAGTYDNPRWKNLEHAIAEQAELATAWQARRVDAKYDDVNAVLESDPGISIIHVAMHGNYDPAGTADGLALIDDEWISPENVLGGPELRDSPFVFLNACQVGAANEVLGQYAGMAAALLEKGAGGVVAPLWKIDDETAHAIANEFYRDTLTERVAVGEAIRRRRAGFRDTGQAGQSSTYVAYQYFGHPRLRLNKEP